MSRRKSLSAVWRDAIRDSDLNPTARHVAHVLSTWMDGRGVCWPSRETIAAGTGLSVRTVERAVARLERGGWLSVEHSPGRRSNVYVALLPVTASESRRREWPNSDSDAPNSDSDAPNSDTGVARKQLKAAESAAPTAAAAPSGSAASGPKDEFAPEDDCHGCGVRTTLAGPDYRYCDECADAIEAISAEGPLDQRRARKGAT